MMNAATIMTSTAGPGENKAPGQRATEKTTGQFGSFLVRQQGQDQAGQQKQMLNGNSSVGAAPMSARQLERAISHLADFGLPADGQLELQGQDTDALMASLAGLLTQLEQVMASAPEGFGEDEIMQLDALVQSLLTELSPEASLQGEDGNGLEQLQQLIDQLQHGMSAGSEVATAEVERAEVAAAGVEKAEVETAEVETAEVAVGEEIAGKKHKEVADRLLAVAEHLRNVADQAAHADKLEAAAQRLTELAEQLKAVSEETAGSAVQLAQAQVVVQGQKTVSEGFVAAADARFGDLLKPRSSETSLFQQHQARSAAETPVSDVSPQPVTEDESFADLLLPKGLDRLIGRSDTHLAQQLGGAKFNQLTEGGQGQPYYHNAPSIQNPSASGVGMMGAATQLAGQSGGMPQVSDSQIFDQVVTHLSGSASGETGRMVLRLHPAELGALRIELMVEGDQLRANLHAQTQQVQDVLERNLNQLRSALAEQGLKIDQFQVSSDARQNQQFGQAEDSSGDRRFDDGKTAAQNHQQQDLTPEDQNLPLAHLLQNGGSGISLRV